MKKVIIVGGGAAGMLAALFAARAGAQVQLLERNEKLGKKLYITGKGRCNLTNAAEQEPFMRHILRNPRFLYAALAALDNVKLMDLIESLGVPVKVERGDRVFPQSEKASDINRALERELRRLGVAIRLNARVRELATEDGHVTGVLLQSGDTVAGDAVILATGGLSYPMTGSTGDGYALARATGHGVTDLLPALVPLETSESWPFALTGLSLKNVTLHAWAGKKRVFSEQGELLFTHFGLSGPLILTLSSLLPADLSDVRLVIDLKPAIDDGTLDQRLLREFRDNSRKSMSTVIDALAPHALGMALLDLAEIPPARSANAVTQEERKRLRVLLKNLPLTPKALRGFDEAVITRGGIRVKDVNPSTLESKLLPGLFFAGELLDLDATTGGFNLQIAFSTGALAGQSAAQ